MRRISDGQLQKDIVYAETAKGRSKAGRPKLRFKDLCKLGMTHFAIDPENWEKYTDHRIIWRSALHSGGCSTNYARWV